MRRRVESLVPEDLRERNLKLSSGSLRDVEFAVQLLQMVHGRVDESLRVLATVDAGGVDRGRLHRARRWGEPVRVVPVHGLLEHRLQLQRLSRTHVLPDPDDDVAMRWLARAAHIRPSADLDAAGVLRNDLRKQRKRIRQLHEKLFYRPLLESVTHFDADELTLSSESAQRRLAALGAKPDRALGHIRALASTAGRRGQIQLLILLSLLEWISRTPTPTPGC